jgi:hypothetical protein
MTEDGMPRTMTSIVAALLLVLFAGPGLGAEITLTPVTFTSEGAPEWLSRALADRGYVVLAQQYRDGDVRYYGRDAEDIRNAISHLQKVPGVEPGWIGIIGHSRAASRASWRQRARRECAPPSR